MADEGHADVTQKTPRDPMWATFRAAHPEVTLVLLPDTPPREPDTQAAGTAEVLAIGASAPRVPLDEAHAAMEALTRKLALVAEMMQCADTSPTAGGWQPRDEALIRPQLQLRTPATESTPTDGELIAVRLGQLGWSAARRPDDTVVWVEGTTPDAFVRVTVIDGWVTVRMTGQSLVVDPADVEHLAEADDV